MADRDYVLGTHDQETRRLGIQHEAWRPIVHECWARAGISPADRVIDVGAGPGYASFDLAAVVGHGGQVIAVERSARFVEAGRAIARGRGVRNIDYHELDLMTDALPGGGYDAAWCRWVASFVDSPRILIDRIADAVRPGGVAVFHEYANYASWRFAPSLPRVEEYVARVMSAWREAGGEPDAAVAIPPLLVARGFNIESVTPHVFCVGPGHAMWTWIATFVEANLWRMIELGSCDREWADAVRSEFRAAQADQSSLMITPTVLEIIARRNTE